MTQFRVSVNYEDVQALFADFAARKRIALGEAAAVVESAIKAELEPHTQAHDGPHVRDSFSSRVISDDAAVVSSNDPVALYLQEGTKPHAISPRNKALRWEDVGGEYYARRVRHPGTKPLHYVQAAIEKSRAAIQEAFTLAFRR